MWRWPKYWQLWGSWIGPSSMRPEMLQRMCRINLSWCKSSESNEEQLWSLNSKAGKWGRGDQRCHVLHNDGCICDYTLRWWKIKGSHRVSDCMSKLIVLWRVQIKSGGTTEFILVLYHKNIRMHKRTSFWGWSVSHWCYIYKHVGKLQIKATLNTARNARISDLKKN